MFSPIEVKTVAYADTVNGRLRGYQQRGIYKFLGVQYGQAARWQTAQPVQPWRGIRNAVQFGSRAFPNQPFTPWDSCGIPHELYPYDEDCLNLNIWTPTLERNAKKPVMVWIHGGAYSTGSAMEMQAHEGEELSRFGDVVVVTVNHRLNVFGFFDVSAFGPQYANSGNCGLSDLVLALQWVQSNIEAFGGDPGNVMIFGQSGGGGKVRALMQTPAADGLYHKAVIMSGAGFQRGKTPASEDNTPSREVLAFLLKRYHTDSLAVLEVLPPEELLAAVHEFTSAAPDRGGLMVWRPNANDYYLGDETLVGIRPHARKIPVMIGCTISEFPAMRIRDKHTFDEQQQLDILRDAFPGQNTERLARLFREAWPNKCLTDAIEIGGMLGRSTVLEYADLRVQSGCAPTYVYLFAHEFPQDGGRGAWHCADIPVVFHNSAFYPESFRNGLLDGLEDAICFSWVSFARNSDPTNPLLKTEWLPYRQGECATMVFDDGCELRCDFDRELSELRDNMILTVNEKYRFTPMIN